MSLLNLGNITAQNQTTTFGSGITVSGLSPLTASQLSTLQNVSLGWEYPTSHQVKKLEIYETPNDVLALSCAMQRLRKEQPGVKFRLLDDTVINNVKHEDKNRAQDIRDYYSKKIMMGKLTEQLAMTNYRQDLNKFIHGSVTQVKSTDVGLVCFLPTFYDQDIELDEVKSLVKLNQDFVSMDKRMTPKALNTSVVLTPLKKLTRKTKNKTTYQFWFKDDLLNAGVVLELTKDNPLMHLWEHMFNNDATIKILGTFARRRLDDFEHFSITNWELDRS